MRNLGENQHICTRVYGLNEKEYIDTNYPAYHIHNPTKSEEAKSWVEGGYQRSFFDNWLNQQWEIELRKNFQKPETKTQVLKLAVYKAKRAFIKTLRNNKV